ncbi:unnamed protein product [Rotaria magnacalcarata]|uniref:Laccase n=4 Tax=Rotaria magnacalcarata TaxID=392030 RepID=A0A816A8W8_9BILA|nr:unnamed protein product [Rotaria magnacalcarata]CAF1681514.1 unnamed protein product [Rotaria magnacalcarata]CAF2082460.1 unnamed protein product [Rotaria magnacalcarata]CAF4528575.1 unnamed protein product [Rotaria magnacalcarata]
MSDAATVYQTLYIDKVYPYPQSSKPVISANYSSPGPVIEAYQGDTLVIRVINRLNVSTTLHWHGMFQIGTPDMDGAVGATQCPIPAGREFTYTFKADPAGTAWYHGHWLEQYTDGLYGPIIIRRQVEPNRAQYDREQVLMVTDWYNEPARSKLSRWYLSTNNPDGVEPLPDAIAVNGKFSQSLFIPVSGTSRIRFRVINGASLSMYKFSIDGLPLHIIELDQIDTAPYNVSSFVINVAQRVSFYIDLRELDPIYSQSGSSSTNSIFIRFQAMTEMYPVDILNYNSPYDIQRYAYPTFFNPLYLAILSLDSTNATPTYQPRDANPMPQMASLPSDSNMLAARPFNLTNYIVPNPTHYLNLVVKFAVDSKGINRGYMNDVTYTFTGNYTKLRPNVFQGIKPETKEPLLQQMANRPNTLGLPSPRVQAGSPLPTIQSDGYGHYLVPYQAVVDIFLNNTDNGEHPFHLHGGNFWIIATSDYPQAENLYRQAYLKRDVVSVPSNGWAKIRFIADNPGAWMFHCHIEWHMAAGLILTFVVAPNQLLAQGYTISNSQYDMCSVA